MLVILAATFACSTATAEDPPAGETHELEELGVNRYTTPSIAQIFMQLDELKPLPFDQLKRDPPALAVANREQKCLVFGELIADGFLLVEAQKKNLIENFGRVLMLQARALGVGDRVMRHSASLTELGRRGEWPRMRQELITTQTDVEQAMIELRDEKMAHLISLGGWLRGLEICAGAVELDFSPKRAKLLAQPDLVDYFESELQTLPPALAHLPLFQKLRAGVTSLQPVLKKSASTITRADVTAIRTRATELNDAIRLGEQILNQQYRRQALCCCYAIFATRWYAFATSSEESPGQPAGAIQYRRLDPAGRLDSVDSHDCCFLFNSEPHP